jgi:hypothetical protein
MEDYAGNVKYVISPYVLLANRRHFKEEHRVFTNISLEQSRQILTENCAALAGEKTLLDQAFTEF